MTSRSRRKRQTTARSIHQKTNLLNHIFGRSTKLRRAARVALAGTAMLALVAMLTSTATADSTYSSDRSVQHSKGQNGAKLKWLPYRPSARMVQRVAQNQRARTADDIELAAYQSNDPSGNQYNVGTSPLRPDTPSSNQNWELPPLEDEPAPTTPAQNHTTPGPTPSTLNPTYTESPSATSPSATSPSATSPPSTINPEDIQPPRGLPEDIRRDIERRRSQEGYRQVPSVQEEIAKGLFKQYDDCPSENDFKPIDELTDKVQIVDGDYPKECTLPWKDFEPRDWESTLFTWKASGLCSNPLYFEEVQLERYGHSWGPYLQPIISQGHFFATVPILPYKMGLNPPHECVYSLGYYRPGDCAPYMIDPLPLSVRAGLTEAAAVLGGVYLIP